jgi:hypothetical protein
MSLVAQTASARSWNGTLLRRLGATAAWHALLLGGALGLWIDSVDHADLSRISGFGLLPALPVTYYVALLLLGAGFLAAVTQRSTPPALAALYVLGLVLVLHGTAPLLYSEPRYAWTYKHLGVTDYIAHFGATDRSIDIYQNWPGFFALVAMLERVSGVSLTAVASWAEVFFEVAAVAAVAFLVRGLTRDWRIVWTSAWLFVLANWLGQDYFAPQSFAYVLYLVLIGVCVRCAPSPGTGGSRWALAARWWGWIERTSSGRRSPWVDDPATVPMRPGPAVVLGGLLFIAIATSHQLSPLLCILAVAAFAATTRRISWWVVIAMVAVELVWLAAAWPLLDSKYHLLSFSPLERPSTPGANSAWALPGIAVQALASQASVAVVVGLALAGLWRRWRAGHWDLPVIALILAPALVIPAQSYGGEGVFRVYLFSLPWLCFLVASAIVPLARKRAATVVRGFAVAGASVLLGGTVLFAFFGDEIANHITPQDVAIEQWYERNAPSGSSVLYLAPNVPNRMTYRYADKQVWAGSFSPALTDDPRFRDRELGVADLPALEAKLRALDGTQDYLMIGPSQVNYVRATGVLPPGSTSSLIAAVRSSNEFELVAQDGNALLFRLVNP